MALHMALVAGLPWRIAVALLGLGATMLTVTGVIIWMRKRSARRLHRQKQDRAGIAVPAVGGDLRPQTQDRT